MSVPRRERMDRLLRSRNPWTGRPLPGQPVVVRRDLFLQAPTLRDQAALGAKSFHFPVKVLERIQGPPHHGVQLIDLLFQESGLHFEVLYALHPIRHVLRGAASRPKVTARQASHEEQKMEAPLDSRKIQELLELTGGETSWLRELLQTYVDDTTQRLGHLATVIAPGGGDRVQRAAHGIKGSSSNIGATGMARLCQEMEAVGAKDDPIAARAKMVEIQAEFERLKAYIPRALPEDA